MSDKPFFQDTTTGEPCPRVGSLMCTVATPEHLHRMIPRTAQPVSDKAAREEAERRFWSKVDKSGTCWLWTKTLSWDGYGQFSYQGRNVRAHRWIYETVVGPIPEGLVIDHVTERGCTSRACVNPNHLEPVTNKVNLLRDGGVSAAAIAKTHCDHGHEFTPENTRVTREGWRLCKTCHRRNVHDSCLRRKAETRG